MRHVAHRRGKTGAERGKQCEAGDDRDQFLGKGGEYRGDGRSEHAENEIKRSACNSGNIALGRIRMGFFSCADRSSNGGKINPVRTKGGKYDRSDPCRRNERAGWRIVAVRLKDADTGSVLRSHRHDAQRNSQTDDGIQGKGRQGEDRLHESDLDASQFKAIQQEGGDQPDQQRKDDGVSRHPALSQEIANNHRQCQRRQLLQGYEDLHAKGKQDSSEHRRGNRWWNVSHDRREKAGYSKQRDDHGREEIGSDRVRERIDRQAGDEQNGTRCRPSRNDGSPIPNAEYDRRQAAADGNRPDPRG